ncbi:339_t:CDS:2 [Cetraspora pellucida]|uniref:RNA polymerase II subunit B1 CTD phosphatase RPAP2 homolog n=1 Tax=Cetraspora pellucida TaxID=1433469 RepID=A0A9N9EZN2_9GLOM|nr:339_t:CDS:2 [Cetraspora pellucida]
MSTSEKKLRKTQKHKSKKNVTFDTQTRTSPQTKLSKKQHLLKQSLETRQSFELLSLEWQEKLYETVSLDLLRDSAKYLLPHHYEEIIEERNASKLCGYPICSKPQQLIQGQYRISYHARKIYDISKLKSYCSTSCFVSSKFFSVQLSDEPLYLRNLQNWKSVDVIPLGVNPSDLIKQDLSKNDIIHPDLNQRTDYIKNLMADLPPAPVELIIKEKEDHELSTPLAPSPNQQDTYNVVEGFHLNSQNVKNLKNESTHSSIDSDTKHLDFQNDENESIQSFADSDTKHLDIQNDKIVDKIIDENVDKVVDEYLDKNVDENVDENVEGSTQSTNSVTKKTLPQKKIVKKKKKAVLQMSLFGKIWTALDRMTTPRTRKHFQGVNSLTLNNDDSSPLCDDVMIMRLQIFTEKIMQCFNLLKKQLHITANIESELIELTSTFTFDNSSVMLTDLENHILCMVFIYTLSIDIPELYENIFSSGNDKNGPFKDLHGSLKLTIEEMDAFVRVLRVGST